MSNTTLKDVRSWLAGDVVEGLPHRDLPDGPPSREPRPGRTPKREVKPRRAQTRKHFTEFTSDDLIDDAKLLFGRFNGRMVSNLARGSQDEKDYLTWILGEAGLPMRLKDIVKIQKRAAKSEQRRTPR